MRSRMKKAFKKGLIKAACSIDSWIITDGVFNGVMKLVGEAVKDAHNPITVIGMLNWDYVTNKEIAEVIFEK